MPAHTIAYNITFRNFQILQGYMARRIFARNRQKYGPALLGVVFCAFFLVLPMLNPYRAVAFAIRCLSIYWSLCAWWQQSCV